MSVLLLFLSRSLSPQMSPPRDHARVRVASHQWSLEADGKAKERKAAAPSTHAAFTPLCQHVLQDLSLCLSLSNWAGLESLDSDKGAASETEGLLICLKRLGFWFQTNRLCFPA